jgi:hypothetical protein
VLKGLETAVGEKGQIGRRPLRREIARSLTEQTLGFRWFTIERSFFTKNVRGLSTGNDVESGLTDGEPSEAQKPKRASAPAPRLIIWVARRGTARWMGVNR